MSYVIYMANLENSDEKQGVIVKTTCFFNSCFFVERVTGLKHTYVCLFRITFKHSSCLNSPFFVFRSSYSRDTFHRRGNCSGCIKYVRITVTLTGILLYKMVPISMKVTDICHIIFIIIRNMTNERNNLQRF